MLTMNDSIQYLKGVGEKRAKLYHKLGVDTIRDLLALFPRAYLDYSDHQSIAQSPINALCCIRATVFKKQGEQRIRQGLSLFKVFVTDGESDMTITIFNSKFAFDALEVDREYCFYGKMQGNLLRREMNAPSFIDPKKEPVVKAIYPLTDGLSSKLVSSSVKQALTLWGDQLIDILPDAVKRQDNLCHLRYAYENIHFPADQNALQIAKKRLVFEELLLLQLGMLLLKFRNREQTAVRITRCNTKPFEHSLPFALTDAQKDAIADGLADLQQDIPMNRLIQGDVGSGKTMVACALAFCMAQNGYQTAIMAPTEILAVQHYQTFQQTLEPLGISCVLLTGSLSAKEKNARKQQITDGTCMIAIGTHTLIQDTVSFHRLGLVVTDEQHRFGVAQRARLAGKGENPHKLIMSATPIPRTLALMIYGDLEVSVIHESPKGRLPIETYLVDSAKRQRAYSFIKKHVDQGRQAYIVCPLIEEGESDKKSVTVYAASLQGTVLDNVRIAVLHGKMKPAEKEQIMRKFKEQQIDVLISTTVVEVGVDVPNAVIMMIENAENFGLSQLHQLRGRVGRGADQSYCILVSDNQGEQTLERLKIMTKSSDGFYIAEQDLKQRGPGDFFGQKQHGLPQLKIANMMDDMAVLIKTQQVAKEVLLDDPNLEQPCHSGLKQKVDELFSDSENSYN